MHTHVQLHAGVDEGDGWVRVGTRYLAKELLRGSSVKIGAIQRRLARNCRG